MPDILDEYVYSPLSEKQPSMRKQPLLKDRFIKDGCQGQHLLNYSL